MHFEVNSHYHSKRLSSDTTTLMTSATSTTMPRAKRIAMEPPTLVTRLGRAEMGRRLTAGVATVLWERSTPVRLERSRASDR